MPFRNFTSQARKIVAIGRNYAEHAKELGNEVPKAPFFFLKPTSSFVTEPNAIEVPKGAVVHHEVELGLIIGKDGRDIPATQADSYIAGYFLALDMTARNLQDEAKKKGLPWSVAKGFDTFTPVGKFIEKSAIPNPDAFRLWLKIDGKSVQDGPTSDMMFKIPQLIEHVSSVMKLEKGDVILTGTPSGVGPVQPGQTLTGGIRPLNSSNDISTFSFPVINRPGSGLFGSGKL
ncbi:hypothetical protein HK097_002109 [Rhizophlyctis rosea]|uniref:Fumarylacetoacetase-like C-terminal domain-containing protein n=1 Tax=Rhizophlyctis rosea TaxID=64517 RepID=A0AAD5S6F3_9FUNG|nr:hypothetical protein HK097_002109 [Rhizophlyctis rosea]